MVSLDDNFDCIHALNSSHGCILFDPQELLHICIHANITLENLGNNLFPNARIVIRVETIGFDLPTADTYARLWINNLKWRDRDTQDLLIFYSKSPNSRTNCQSFFSRASTVTLANGESLAPSFNRLRTSPIS